MNILDTGTGCLPETLATLAEGRSRDAAGFLARAVSGRAGVDEPLPEAARPQTRQTLCDTLQFLAEGGVKRMALWGTGETTTLAYLTFRELDIEPVAVLDGDGGDRFLACPVRDTGALASENFDCVRVTALEAFERAFEELDDRGIPRDRVVRPDLHRPAEREGG